MKSRVVRAMVAGLVTLILSVAILYLLPDRSLPEDPRTAYMLIALWLGTPWSLAVPGAVEEWAGASLLLGHVMYFVPVAMNVGILAALVPTSGAHGQNDRSDSHSN